MASTLQQLEAKLIVSKLHYGFITPLRFSLPNTNVTFYALLAVLSHVISNTDPTYRTFKHKHGGILLNC